MISQTAEYALCAVVRLASCGGVPQTVRQIALDTSMPVSYLPKVLSYLHRAGIISSQRGPHGGILLLRDPEELSLGEVVQAVEPSLRVCALPACPRKVRPELLPLFDLLAEQVDEVLRSLGSTTVADVLAEANGRGRRPQPTRSRRAQTH